MPTKLSIPNENGKLNCQGFIHISFAPAREIVREKDFDIVYEIEHDGEALQVKLVDFLRVKFEWMGSAFTVPATGMRSDEWRVNWMSKHPQTKADTELGVYCYSRV